MTTKANLTQAVGLAAELDQVTAAIALVNAGGYRVVIEIGADDHAAMRFNASAIPAATLLAQLTARQTALQNALTALGVS
jgi:hypothetical protein